MKISSVFFLFVFAFVIGPKSDHCLIPESLLSPRCETWLVGFVKALTWICLDCYMELSMMLHDLSCCHKHFTPLPNQNNLKFGQPRLWGLLILLCLLGFVLTSVSCTAIQTFPKIRVLSFQILEGICDYLLLSQVVNRVKALD